MCQLTESISCVAQQSLQTSAIAIFEDKKKDTVRAIEHFPTVVRQIIIVNEQEHY